MGRRAFAIAVLAGSLAGGHMILAAQQQPQSSSRASQPGQPARDTPAQTPQTAEARGRISGRVLTADTGRPVRRARVFINATELPGGRGAQTDDQGTFDFTALPAGRYSLTVSKTGFVTISYGQRRPLQAGTPLQLADNQELTGLTMSLPRGSAITGHIYDETGEPLPGAMVRVSRYQYAQGTRELVPAGTTQTDDLGAYRVWGLDPGDYYVSAMPRQGDFGGRMAAVTEAVGAVGPGGGPAGGFGGGRGGGARGRGGPADVPGAFVRGGRFGDSSDGEPERYAATYYPGVASVAESRAVTVGLSTEVPAIDFGVLLIRTARVSGRVTSVEGRGGVVTLVAEGQRPAVAGPPLAGPIQPDGSFSIANVAPGRYTLVARTGGRETQRFARQPLTVTDGDVFNVIVALLAPGGISGTVQFQSSTSAAVPDASQVRVAAPPVETFNMGPNPIARVDRATAAFTLDGVSPGLHWIRSQTPLRGWILKSVTVNGRDMIDTPVEIESGKTLSGVSLVFTDKLSEISGTMTDSRGQPITDFTVVAFSEDPSVWRPQSRQIMTARPDQNGRYQIRGLPPGAYYVAAIDPAVQGEWYEPAFLERHRNGAARISLTEGDVKTQDFSIK